MTDKNKCSRVFESASKSTLLTSGPTVCLGILAVVIIILSATQAFTMVNPSDDDDAVKSWEDLCGSEGMGYLSPFHFEMKDSGGNVACQWRPRNTILRLVIVSITILECGLQLFVLFSGKFESLWPVFYWTNWIIFVMMFVAFVLDCDGINTGANLCRNDFKIDGQPVIYIQLGDTDSTFLGFPISAIEPQAVEVEKCKVDPFVFTALADLLASLMAFCAYKISRYYIFDPTERKASIGNFSGKISKPSSNGNTQTKENGATGNNTTSASTTQQLAGGGGDGGNRKDSDPFADYHGGYEVSPDNRKETGGSAYGGSAYDGRMSAYDE